ncbi:FxLYD domain-containing protein [Croceicoccus gelatinilyticus]|uniref:FxLYD domain-containing protein n=1 Tax=Croceicoccus gelatinilyticus TaxID=2835536 RepID=UPI001BD0BF3A|nr:FxLYD domain-containing protein [Croceicoccus gelatinilyticus]MBS7671409.1 FxLYD domain-containing protein [Croceicoccus gelatinilyticus]
MTNKNLSLIGAALLVAGLFVPIVKLPIIGSVNLFNSGSNLLGLIILALAIVIAGLAATEKIKEAFWPAGAAAAFIVFLFVRLQIHITNMRSSLDELGDNPFRGLAEAAASAVQVEWGWLVLAVGAGTALYAAFQDRKAVEGAKPLAVQEGVDKKMAVLAAVLLIAGVAIALYQDGVGSSDDEWPGTPVSSLEDQADAIDAAAEAFDPMMDEAADQSNSSAERSYLSQVDVYDLKASYMDSMLDGRVPGVEFKVKNNGDKTLNEVKVTVVFYDADGNAIAEEDYYPVLVSSYSSSGTPLKPGYIWRQERGRFYSAKSVPEEWAAGKVTASVTDVEFAD